MEIGHRRKLQKEIKETRSLAEANQAQHMQKYSYRGYDQQQKATYQDLGNFDALSTEPDPYTTQPTVPTKRGYRHHPKTDPNAPKRPYSAYILFSNHVRDLLASKKLDFPEISRQVGQRWQALDADEKDVWRLKAQPVWDKYKSELAEYQDTQEDAEHKRYLETFKADQANKMGGGVPKGSISNEVPKRATAGIGGVSRMLPTPGHTSADTTEAPGESKSPTTTSAKASLLGMRFDEPSALRESEATLRSPIERDRELHKELDRKPKSKQACEPCRRKKTKCNEKRPSCGHCLATEIECFYSNVKTDKRYTSWIRFKRSWMNAADILCWSRMFQEMSEKFEACQNLLARIKPQVAKDEQILIQQFLDSVGITPVLFCFWTNSQIILNSHWMLPGTALSPFLAKGGASRSQCRRFYLSSHRC